jgi:LytS/YehU family sensor histidine kinase
MRFLRILALVIGWLLTPLVVWAASVLGAYVGATIGLALPTADSSLVSTAVGGVIAGMVTVYLWMRLLRRSPRLRRSLAITREGIPMTGELIQAIHEADASLRKSGEKTVEETEEAES